MPKGFGSSGTIFVAVISIICLMPMTSAISGYAWSGASESEYGMGAVVTYSPNGDIIASAHGSTVMISDAITHETSQIFHVDFFVESLQFTSDANYLVIGMESTLPNTPGTVVFELVDDQYIRNKHTEDGINVDRISISPDDMTFATAVEDGNFVEWKIDTGSGSNLDIDREYISPHVGKITCLDHSLDGSHILSGAEDGLVVLWNRTDQTEVARWESVEPILDCSFSNDGTLMSWIAAGSLFIRNHDTTQSYYGQFDISVDATRMAFAPADNEIAILIPVLDSEYLRKIEFVEVTSLPFQLSRVLFIPHPATTFSFHPFEANIAISTGTKLVAFYANSIPVETEIPSLLDTDQDNIPNTIDDDDDGDGILDVYDNICPAGNNCDIQPNQEMIRRFSISVDGDQISVIESIHLNPTTSHQLRLLAALSVTNNHRVDIEEYTAMETSICSEYDADEIKSRWRAHLSVENEPFTPTTVTCRVGSGLYATMDDDTGTRIQVSWTIEGTTLNPHQAPYNLSIESGLQTPSASIAQNVHSFPVHVQIQDISGTRIDHEIWNRRDADLFIEVSIPPVGEPDNIETFVEIVFEYWYIFSVLIVLIGVTSYIALLRKKNSVDFSELDDTEDVYEQDEEWENLVDDAAAWDEVGDITTRKPTPPTAVMRDLKRQPKPPSAVRRDLAQAKHMDPDTPLRKVRKTKSAVVDTVDESTGEIGFTHLVDASESIQDESANDDEMEDALAFITSNDENKSKKRRPVRRKKSSD